MQAMFITETGSIYLIYLFLEGGNVGTREQQTTLSNGFYFYFAVFQIFRIFFDSVFHLPIPFLDFTQVPIVFSQECHHKIINALRAEVHLEYRVDHMEVSVTYWVNSLLL